LKNAKIILVRLGHLRINNAINIKTHLRKTDCGIEKSMEQAQVLSDERGICY
jgi:hypothetical protein